MLSASLSSVSSLFSHTAFLQRPYALPQWTIEFRYVQMFTWSSVIYNAGLMLLMKSEIGGTRSMQGEREIRTEFRSENLIR